MPSGLLLVVGLSAAAGTPDIEALMHAWSGTHDSSEAVMAQEQPLPDNERRISTLVAPVSLPWLGEHVLYLEERPYDEPEAPRRQLLLKLEPGGVEGTIRAQLYAFLNPGRWIHLDRRIALQQRLSARDLRHFEGCDLTFTRLRSQFQGATHGRRCLAGSRARPPGVSGPLHVDYRVVLDTNVYWYRRRLLAANGALVEEVVGFNWFELNEARLFTCRIDWSSTGHSHDLKPLVRLDLHDKGGRGELTTPDGRHLVLTLHSQDWPYAAEHDALVLLLSEPGKPEPLASAWAVVDDQQVTLRLGWLRVRCGAIQPSQDEVRG